MTGAAMKTLFYLLYRQKSTNTSVSDAYLSSLLTLGYQRVVTDVWVNSLDTEATITVPVTTIATRTSNTVWTVASASGFSNGQLVCVYTPTRYDIARLASTGGVSGSTLTFDSPGVTYVHTTASKVTPLEFTISAAREIRAAYWHKYTATLNEVTVMQPVSDEEMWTLGANPSTYGVPNSYAIMTPTTIRVPIPAEVAGYIKLRYKNRTEYSVNTTGTDTDEPILDEDLHLAIVMFALQLISVRDRDLDQFKLYSQAYKYIVDTYRMEQSIKMSNNVQFGLTPESVD